MESDGGGNEGVRNERLRLRSVAESRGEAELVPESKGRQLKV